MRGSLVRSGLALAGLLPAVVFAGCSSTTSAGSANPMMGGGSGYKYSRLTCSAPASVPGQRVTVVLADMGMSRMMDGVAPRSVHMMLRAVPATVTAGQVTLVAENMGWRTHELVVLPLAVRATVGARIPGSDGKVDETGSLGEASGSCTGGTGDGILGGSVGWVTLTLTPGRYELVCNQPNHYADGMRQEFDVS